MSIILFELFLFPFYLYYYSVAVLSSDLPPSLRFSSCRNKMKPIPAVNFFSFCDIHPPSNAEMLDPTANLHRIRTFGTPVLALTSSRTFAIAPGAEHSGNLNLNPACAWNTPRTPHTNQRAKRQRLHPLHLLSTRSYESISLLCFHLHLGWEGAELPQPTGADFTELNHHIVEPIDAPMNRADRKGYRDRDRYLQMTPSQREAYLQRNREYKRAKQDSNASGSSAQSTTGQTNVSYNDNIGMLMESALVTEDCCMLRSTRMFLKYETRFGKIYTARIYCLNGLLIITV
ncbi:hypothetical protein BRADI_3g04033v3 [Brachypodium distachyon]|uniref:Uncharacterized protein n=1 Tax=Brachypodium distachyon TaxID=15368 RepID=A0A2K2CV45_BRADI|nr:hypothetical protein BRADI_3g04033v3 [Brachypodium distachyon]